jgi:hypothetical protein
MEKDTGLYLVGKVTSQDDYDPTKLFILPLNKSTLKSLRLARFLAWIIRELLAIEMLGALICSCYSTHQRENPALSG